jgi:hypothetical protein
MLLPSEEHAAVAQVHRQLAALADGYGDSAGLARMQGWPELARMLDELGAERAAMRRRVSSLLSDLGGAARDPDRARAPERRDLNCQVARQVTRHVTRMTRRVRVLLGADQQPALVRELERKEDLLAAALAAVMALDLPDRVASALARIRTALDRARRKLAETRISLSHARPASPVRMAS